MYDLIIIGAGPAGMTAGVYAARKQLKTLVLSENIGGQTLLSSAVENYLGYIYISGIDLAQRFKEHLDKFDIEITYEMVISLKLPDKQFELQTREGKKYTTPAVIVASGKSPRTLNIPGEKEFAGRGVTYCSTCDAPLFRDMNVAVIGGGNSGLDATIQLSKLSPKIYLIEYSSVLKADEVFQEQAGAAKNVKILTNTEILAIKGHKMVESIVVKNRQTGELRELPVKGVFVEIGLTPNVNFIPKEVALNQRNEIKVDERCKTNLEGLFAAGDVTDVPEKQIIVAAGEGSKAALAAYEYLIRAKLVKAGG